jgi:hypothetical protein
VGGGHGCETKTSEPNKKHSERGKAAANVGGRQEIDDGTEDLKQEHNEGTKRHLPLAVARRFNR